MNDKGLFALRTGLYREQRSAKPKEPRKPPDPPKADLQSRKIPGAHILDLLFRQHINLNA